MPAVPRARQDRARQIRDDLEAVIGNFLALSDDVYLRADHYDARAR